MTNDEFDMYREIAQNTDHQNRMLFIKHVNEFFDEAIHQRKVRITYVKHYEDEDTLIVSEDNVFAVINTHANSILVTAECLSEWLMHGTCAGCNGKLYHIDTLPEFIVNQLKEQQFIE